jgi:hypothetical protein
VLKGNSRIPVRLHGLASAFGQINFLLRVDPEGLLLTDIVLGVSEVIGRNLGSLIS